LAILDTDFISKLHETTNGEKQTLIDKVLELPYSFCCHRKTGEELQKHLPWAEPWLTEKSESSIIHIYSDPELITLLSKNAFSGNLSNALLLYRQFLHDSCEIFSRHFYETHYQKLETLTKNPTIEQITAALNSDDSSVERGKNLGEIKSCTMMKIFAWLEESPIFQFFSDDFSARRSMIQDPRTPSNMYCISAIGVFYVLKEKQLLQKPQAKEFFDSWMKFHARTNQTKFKIQGSKKGSQLEKVEGYTIFEGIYSEIFELGRDGLLQYCQHSLT
jgi:hypothetical protein